MPKNYTLYSKKTRRKIKDFLWFEGMAFRHESLADYVARKWPFGYALPINA